MQCGEFARQRGATMVSVLLLMVSMLTIAVLVVRTSKRELDQANALVARERALSAAQATAELGAAQLRRAIAESGSAASVLDAALSGYNPAGNPSLCASLYADCIPGGGDDPQTAKTGQKNHWVTGMSDCAGSPCMRQGAIVRLPNTQGADEDWVQVPLRQLLAGADARARVSLWIRNNTADALDDAGSGSWIADTDGRVVLTAMATVDNTTVTVEQEYSLRPADPSQSWSMTTPDISYGGGHNNDNVTADVCLENFAGYEE